MGDPVDPVARPAPDINPDDVGPLLGGLSAPLAAISTRVPRDVSNAQIAVAITAASIVPQRPRLIVQIYHTNFTHGLISVQRRPGNQLPGNLHSYRSSGSWACIRVATETSLRV